MKLKNFTTNADVNGTSLQGYIQAYYHDLVKVFGEPKKGGDKTTVEWCLNFADSTPDGAPRPCVTSIYDWKESETPMGLHRWHIGGHNNNAVDAVHETFYQTFPY